MRRLATLAALTLALAGCGGGDDDGGGGDGPAATSLTIAFWEDSARPASRVDWTLECDPASGTHPDPDAACARLAETGADAFAPLPDQACTEIYGGPQRAEIAGSVDGEPVDAVFQRTNGCEIEAWDALAGVLPPGGV
jgi:hypothetical protein